MEEEAKTTEQRWSLKVTYERDVAEQALSLGYTAGSVATDCSSRCSSSPSLCVFLSSLALSDIILLLPASSVFVCLHFPSAGTLLTVYEFLFPLVFAVLPPSLWINVE